MISKRSKMGKIASDYSDRIYLTDDNPRFENPKKIREDIKVTPMILRNIKKTIRYNKSFSNALLKLYLINFHILFY